MTLSPMADSDAQAGLYLHIPFCSAICPYCDFSVLRGGEAQRQSFVETLLAEIALAGEEPWSFDTLYFGGGTPSLLTEEALAKILEALARHFSWGQERKIFLEANPEDVDEERLEAWRRLGIETLSLGVQSFQDENLRFLGRRHSGEQGRRAARLALEAGFTTVSVDLIYGLPGQTEASWQQDLEAAVALEPDHLSCYQLTVHQGTPFGFRQARGKLVELPEEGQAERFRQTHRFLGDHGYPGYEVSNFAAATEHESRHNRKYWQHSPYLGLGPSAHSFAGHRRWWNERKLGPWSRAVAQGQRPIEGSEELTPEDLVLEALMLGFRTYEGPDLARLQRRFGLELWERNRPRIQLLEEAGLLDVHGTRLRPTLEGLAVADGLAVGFEI